MQLLAAADLAALVMPAAELQPAPLVIDTQARVTVGSEENSAKDMGMLVAAADRIRAATLACVVLVRHEARNGDNMRGSTSLEGAAASILRVTKDGAHIRLDTTKQKDLAEPGPVALRLAPHHGSAVNRSCDGAAPAQDLACRRAPILAVLRDRSGPPGRRVTGSWRCPGWARRRSTGH